MSYHVALTKSPIPADDATAWLTLEQQIDRLHQEEAEPAPVFLTLHARLTRLYPCICDLPDSKIDEGVWSDGPLINNFGRECAVIGIVNSSVEKVLHFVVQEANRLGLTVFDWATECIYRPQPSSC